MDDAALIVISLILLGLILAAAVLPIVALIISIRTRRMVTIELSNLLRSSSLSSGPQLPAQTSTLADASIRKLEARIAALEVALKMQPPLPTETVGPAAPLPSQPIPTAPREPPAPQPPATAPPAQETTQPTLPQLKLTALNTENIESVIGRRWLGWAAVVIIIFAAAFFLKYAFDNRWIGELGRVAIGIVVGVSLTVLGYSYYRRNWRIFSQILTAAGIVVLYLSIYAAFGYYHLTSQKTAFVYLAVLILETGGLALLYNAPAIAIMALFGGFLTPVLLHGDRDQYRSLFGYIAALDAGALGLLKHWQGLASLAFVGTHFLFWSWYGGNYHPSKLTAVMVFQTVVFLLFLLSHIAKRFKDQIVTTEDFCLLVINPFVYFATVYYLLNPAHHDWMGVLAVVMALVYAGITKLLFDRSQTSGTERLLTIGVGLTFITLAIPIQLKANWITISWAVEGLGLLWVGSETRLWKLRATAHAVLASALLKLVFWDTPLARGPFTPILNKYFLSSLAVIVCVFAAANIYRTMGQKKRLVVSPHITLVILLMGIAILWYVLSVETFTFFDVVVAAHERWLGQMALSVLWAIYATVLAAIGFVRRVPAIRWAALALFAMTVVKAMLVDIAALEQLYRIIVFFVLGLLLLVVAWGYHKAFHSKEFAK